MGNSLVQNNIWRASTPRKLKKVIHHDVFFVRKKTSALAVVDSIAYGSSSPKYNRKAARSKGSPASNKCLFITILFSQLNKKCRLCYNELVRMQN